MHERRSYLGKGQHTSLHLDLLHLSFFLNPPCWAQSWEVNRQAVSLLSRKSFSLKFSSDSHLPNPGDFSQFRIQNIVESFQPFADSQINCIFFYFFWDPCPKLKAKKRLLISLFLLLHLSFFFVLNFIHFWLHWVFIAVRRLSLVVVGRGSSCCSVQASHCSGFSCCRAQALGQAGSVAVKHRLQSMNSVVVVYRHNCPAACGIFLYQGSNPCPQHWRVDS